jgi:hypothetical protein
MDRDSSGDGVTSDDEILNQLHADWQRSEPPHPDMPSTSSAAQCRLRQQRYARLLINITSVIIVLTPLIIAVELIWFDDWRVWVTTLIGCAGTAFVLSLIAGELKKRGGVQ